MKIPNFKTAEEMEIYFNFNKVEGEKFQLITTLVPEIFHNLLPYVDYFVSDTQEMRESFCKNVPIDAYKFLIQRVKEVQIELIDWLAIEAKNIENLSVEFIAFAILSEIVDNAPGYRREFKREISQKEQSEIIERDEKTMAEIRKKYNLPENDL